MTSPTLDGAPTNWGRWGPGDEVGCLNFLGSAEVLAGVASVRQGKVITLGSELCRPNGDLTSPGRTTNMRLTSVDKGHFVNSMMTRYANGGEWADDFLLLYAHGSTHIDALGHFWSGDAIYNGRSADSTLGGLTYASVSAIAERGIVGRGILLDIARYRGVDYLGPGEAVTLDELLATAKAQGVTLQPHDILLLRTGWYGHVSNDPGSHADSFAEFAEPGLQHSAELVRWFHEMEIAFLGSDNFTNECWASRDDPRTLALHVALMSRLGVVFSEINDLDRLAADCAADGQWTFLYVAAPLRINAASGAPVNPVVIK